MKIVHNYKAVTYEVKHQTCQIKVNYVLEDNFIVNISNNKS